MTAITSAALFRSESKGSSFHANECPEENISTINSKYYSVDEINKVQLSKQHFSVFHTNIRSLSKNHDTLHTQLSVIN